jgi:hypothetical protein
MHIEDCKLNGKVPAGSAVSRRAAEQRFGEIVGQTRKLLKEALGDNSYDDPKDLF